MTLLCIVSMSLMASVMTKLYPTIKKQLCVVQKVNGPLQHLDLKIIICLNTNKNYQIIWMSKTGSHFFLFNFYPTWSLMDWRPLHVVWLEKQHISCLPSSQWRMSECCCHLLVIFCPTDFPYSMFTYIT